MLLAQTSSELPPVAGVLTRGEGNRLSHVQLLARNFGIPNIAMGDREADRLAEFDGDLIEVISASDGSDTDPPACRNRGHTCNWRS